MTTNPSSQLRLGSSLQDFLRILQLDPSNAKDVKLYQTMLVSIHRQQPSTCPSTPLTTSMLTTNPPTYFPLSKKSKPAACASATTAPRSSPNSSPTQRSKRPSTEPKSTTQSSCKNPRVFTSLRPRRAARGIIWRIIRGGAIVRRRRSIGCFGRRCGLGSSMGLESSSRISWRGLSRGLSTCFGEAG